jgi:hypothetical protein
MGLLPIALGVGLGIGLPIAMFNRVRRGLDGGLSAALAAACCQGSRLGELGWLRLRSLPRRLAVTPRV